MNIALVGCVEFSRNALETLKALTSITLCGIVTKKQSSFNADFVDLGQHVEDLKTPVYYYQKDQKDDLKKFLRNVQPDIIFCIGWSHIMKKDILDIAPMGCLGYHPAALPKNRGRHPIIWALALGLRETASTFFLMRETADSGPIVDQKSLTIDAEDNATTLYKKLLSVSSTQLKSICNDLIAGRMSAIDQNHAEATSWRKRSIVDGIIDWRMSANSIHNLVRALTPPYPGALCKVKEKQAVIWNTRVEFGNTPSNMIHGTVLCRNGQELLVKCGEQAIWLLKHEINELPEEGDCL